MTQIRHVFVAFALATFALPAYSNLLIFDATLTGAQQVPPNASTATGFGTVLLDDAALTITVNLSWSGLTGPATAAHIHGPAPVGINAAVLFPFSAVPAATAGSIPQQVFPITLPQISQLEGGLFQHPHPAVPRG
jgi:hypothetical protein